LVLVTESIIVGAQSVLNLLLAGGDKSTQVRDIKRAKEMVGILKKEWEHEKGKKNKGKN
jgi:hypothetical protein